MQIGILTFHRAINYGAVLQAYALRKYLTAKGHEVHVVDYRQPFIENVYKAFDMKRYKRKNFVKAFRRFYRDFSYSRIAECKRRSFDIFNRRYLNLSEPVERLSEMPGGYDLYIAGSDQIWNFRLTGGADKAFFCDFPTKAGVKKIAYAASMEVRELRSDEQMVFSKRLTYLDAISVREKPLVEQLQPYTSTKIVQAVDPTLLLPSEEWRELTTERKGRYIAKYVVGSDVMTSQLASHLAKEKGLPVVDINREACSPEDFLSLISSAEVVLSNSFHATVFSLLFKRDFYTIADGKASDERYVSMLESIGLGNRVVKDLKNVTAESIDYDSINVDGRLADLRRKSEEFLSEYA